MKNKTRQWWECEEGITITSLVIDIFQKCLTALEQESRTIEQYVSVYNKD